MAGPVHMTNLAAELNLERHTVRRYISEFRIIERDFPKQLNNLKFFLPVSRKEKALSAQKVQFLDTFPGLIEKIKTPRIQLEQLWRDFREIHPDGYGNWWFRYYAKIWLEKNNICPFYPSRIMIVSEADMKVLNYWRASDDLNHWRKAAVILGSYDGRHIIELALKVERSLETILLWVKAYKLNGIAGLEMKPYTPNSYLLEMLEVKQQRLIKLLQETPKNHGLNRTSWRIDDMVTIYSKLYAQQISHACVSENLKKIGYGRRKSRERLTSPDPHFTTKMEKIKRILSNLQPNERFFSVDEYGPFAVKAKTGWNFVRYGQDRNIPQVQKSKGWFIITAALELSTNQVTHFYSKVKNTAEMIKLIKLLQVQYCDQRKLYISWDCATWHSSKKLHDWLKEINKLPYRKANHTPLIELAPLPSSAQFLNVIESVFSGMAKGVIHNSDYVTEIECRCAVDRHFQERNEHFLSNPKRAGKKIWGKEIVEPVFDEYQNCKGRI